ncbi:hypothetical protein HK405_000304, partial [Cladochytrium tenue]
MTASQTLYSPDPRAGDASSARLAAGGVETPKRGRSADKNSRPENLGGSGQAGRRTIVVEPIDFAERILATNAANAAADQGGAGTGNAASGRLGSQLSHVTHQGQTQRRSPSSGAGTASGLQRTSTPPAAAVAAAQHQRQPTYVSSRGGSYEGSVSDDQTGGGDEYYGAKRIRPGGGTAARGDTVGPAVMGVTAAAENTEVVVDVDGQHGSGGSGRDNSGVASGELGYGHVGDGGGGGNYWMHSPSGVEEGFNVDPPYSQDGIYLQAGEEWRVR